MKRYVFINRYDTDWHADIKEFKNYEEYKHYAFVVDDIGVFEDWGFFEIKKDKGIEGALEEADSYFGFYEYALEQLKIELGIENIVDKLKEELRE